MARDCASACTLYSMGDCIAQNLEANLGITSPNKNDYNYERTARMAAFGEWVLTSTLHSPHHTATVCPAPPRPGV